jgi:hypothetical protein
VASLTRGRTSSNHGPATTAGGPPAREAERVLRRVERNLTALTVYSPYGGDGGSPTIDATSCSWGTMDLGPALPVFGKCCCSLWKGQQALPLDRLDYSRAKGTFCIFLRA